MLDLTTFQASSLGAFGVGVAISLMFVLFKPILRKRLTVSKAKDSSATSSIIMRRFMMQGSENDPFVGFWAQNHGDDEALIDIGAWSGGLDH